MQVQFSNLTFMGMPKNFGKVDKMISRSAQPMKDEFVWLKEKGVTDIFDFRTAHLPEIGFNEKELVESLGMRYHSIPSYTRSPKEENIERFLKEIEEVKNRNGVAHMHCKAGADRTGMYAFIYKCKENIGNIPLNRAEWLVFGHHKDLFPDLIDWTINFVKKFKS